MSETERFFICGTKIGNYSIQTLIGQGGFGNVYKVMDKNTKQSYALKIEFENVKNGFLENEIQCLENNSYEGFPTIINHGSFHNSKYYVMPLYGLSISELRKRNKGKIEPEIAYPIIHGMFVILKELHQKGYVHLDVKPSNFLLQNNPNHPLVLVDFGLAELHIDQLTKKPFQPKETNPFKGTKKYASPFAHLRKPLGRRDDLISWFFSAIELLNGELPWSECESIDDLKEIKKRITASALCKGLSKHLIPIYQHLINLKYDSKPCYRNIENQLKLVFQEYNIIPETFDWTSIYVQSKSKLLPSNSNYLFSNSTDKNENGSNTSPKRHVNISHHQRTKSESRIKVKHKSKHSSDMEHSSENPNSEECVIY